MCFDAKVKRKAYRHFLDSLKAAYSGLYTQVSAALVDIVLDTIVDKDGTWFQELPKKLDPPGLTSASASVEKPDTPGGEEILSELTRRFPTSKTTQDQKMTASIKSIFLKTTLAHTSAITVCKELAKISDKVSPEEFNFILATSIRPMIQLDVPAACLNPVSVPLPPMPKSPSQDEKATYIKEAKTATLPDKDHAKLA